MTAVVHLVAAARPNFMKVAPLYHALKATDWCRPVLVHTGQHYDANMSDAFFRDLALPEPDHDLGVGSGSHAEQTAGVMIAYERLCLAARPDWVVVVGDVNSTLACALTAKKLCLPVAHLEAGLRSGDRSMPEEINRIATDAIADLLWTPSPDADENLYREGVPRHDVERVGNVMIDSYEMLRQRIDQARMASKMRLRDGAYGIVTLHRPANVDKRERLREITSALTLIAKRLPLVFPAHPRTQERLRSFELQQKFESGGVRLVAPLGYIDFMSLVSSARFVLTDSGGIQEETTYLRIPCLTLREITERPVTVTEGSNRLVSPINLTAAVDEILAGPLHLGKPPALWDGRAAARVVESLQRRVLLKLQQGIRNGETSGYNTL